MTHPLAPKSPPDMARHPTPPAPAQTRSHAMHTFPTQGFLATSEMAHQATCTHSRARLILTPWPHQFPPSPRRAQSARSGCTLTTRQPRCGRSEKHARTLKRFSRWVREIWSAGPRPANGPNRAAEHVLPPLHGSDGGQFETFRASPCGASNPTTRDRAVAIVGRLRGAPTVARWHRLVPPGPGAGLWLQYQFDDKHVLS